MDLFPFCSWWYLKKFIIRELLPRILSNIFSTIIFASLFFFFFNNDSPLHSSLCSIFPVLRPDRMFSRNTTRLSVCKRIVKKEEAEVTTNAIWSLVFRIGKTVRPVQAGISFLFRSSSSPSSRLDTFAVHASWTRELKESWRLDELQPPTPDDSWFYQDRCAPSSGKFPTLPMHAV